MNDCSVVEYGPENVFPTRGNYFPTQNIQVTPQVAFKKCLFSSGAPSQVISSYRREVLPRKTFHNLLRKEI
jgi:hypothetical protein